jgi:hypothetical protein
MAQVCRDDLPDEQSDKYFARGLDARFNKLPVGQITQAITARLAVQILEGRDRAAFPSADQVEQCPLFERKLASLRDTRTSAVGPKAKLQLLPK